MGRYLSDTRPLAGKLTLEQRKLLKPDRRTGGDPPNYDPTPDPRLDPRTRLCPGCDRLLYPGELCCGTLPREFGGTR